MKDVQEKDSVMGVIGKQKIPSLSITVWHHGVSLVMPDSDPRTDFSSTPHITKTYLYNFDPLKPHVYIVKLGFTGVYIIFLISAKNIDCGYPLEPPRRGGSNEYPQSMFCAEI